MRAAVIVTIVAGPLAGGTLPGGGSVLAAPKPCAAKPAPRVDFNGDGYADLAVGVPDEDVGGGGGVPAVIDAGAINVIFGSAAGLASGGNQFFHQDSGIGGEGAEQNDRFGRALAAGDFNGDGFSDLAVAVAHEDVGLITDAGGVHILYGSSIGLTTVGNQFWTQNSGIEGGGAEVQDFFGASLAAGDFNGDGYADLAVGVGEDVSGIIGAGAVNILYGSPSGLTATGNQIWHQDSDIIEDSAETNDGFGGALVVGDFNGDDFADLAVGVPGEILPVPTPVFGGAVNVLYGSSVGLSSAGNQFWHQDSTDIVDVAEGLDRFGQALAAGDFDADGFTDLAVGVSGESLVLGSITKTDAGAVNILYGTSSGLASADNQVWHQDVAGIIGVAEAEDHFGFALAAADLNGDRFADLAVGVYQEDVGSVSNAGAANVIYGSTKGLAATGNQLWHQNSGGIQGEAEANDWLGFSVAADDYNKNGCNDLAIGSPLEDVGTTNAAGAVNVLYGMSTGLSSAGNQIWHQDSPGILDLPEDPDDNFGWALAGR